MTLRHGLGHKFPVERRAQRKGIDDYLAHLEGLIAMLRSEVPQVEQLDWAYHGLRPEFKKVIRKFDFRDFDELARLARSWEMACSSDKEYRAPPSPASSFLPQFAYPPKTTLAAHKRTLVSAVTETETPPKNSGEPDPGN